MALFGLSEDELKEREKELLQREKAFENGEEKLQVKESGFQAKQKELQNRIDQIEEREKGCVDKVASLNSREDAIAAREQEADSGFPEREAEFQASKQKQEQSLLKRENSIRTKEQELMSRSDEITARDEKNLEKVTELNRRDDAVSKRERDAEAGFPDQEAELRASLETIYQDRRESLDTMTEELEVKRVELAERERCVHAKEVTADAGFAKRNENSLAQLQEQTESLRLENEQLTQQIGQRRARLLSEMEETLEQERVERTDALQATIKAKHQQQVEQEQELERLQEERLTLVAELTAEKEATNATRVELDSQLKATEIQRERLSERASELALSEVTELEKKLEAQTARIRRLEDNLALKESRVWDLEETQLRIGERTSDQVLQELDALKKSNSRYVDELADRPTQEQLQDLQAQVVNIDELNAKVFAVQGELKKAKKQAMENRVGVHELEAQRDEAERYKRIADAMKKHVDQLISEIDRITGLQEQAKANIDKRRKAIQTPTGEFDLTRQIVDPENEQAWLEGIFAGCENSGYVFPNRLVESFHTALKVGDWSPLTVLAGVSGTGKSRLPDLYSRFGGMEFLSVPVQPNWDSPASLLGFFNAIDNEFNATHLLRALDQFSRPEEEGLQDRILLVLLDEMNLAYVELYLSDFLSLWEERRDAEEVPPVHLDLGAGAESYELRVDNNVLWCGTMNQDETTKSLSDKVVDRGSVLYFPRPESLVSRSRPDLTSPGDALSHATWKSWIRTSDQLPDDVGKKIDSFRSVIEDINECLESSGRAMGHRLWQTVESYIANHPRVIQATDADDQDALDKALSLAFADQVVMKVMPKLRGIETTGDQRSHCLDPIKNILAKESLGLEDDFNLACESAFGVFSWASAKYLSETR